MNGATHGDFPYLKSVGVITLAAVVLGAYPFATATTPEIARSAAAGLVLSIVHALMGYAVVRFSAGRPAAEFMQIVLGGIAVRLMVMVGLLLVAVGVLRFHAFALISTLFIFYIIFLAMEVLFIHRSVTQQQQTT